MRLIVSYCGRVIDVKQNLKQFQTFEHFLDCVSLATGIPSDAIICITNRGVQVNEEAIDHLIEYEREETMEFYVFDRKLLYADLEVIAPQLEITLEPQPELPLPQNVDGTLYPDLHKLSNWFHEVSHLVADQYAMASDIHECLGRIQDSTRVALHNLETHAKTIKSALNTLEEIAAREFGAIESLLERYEYDIAILSQVRIEPEVMTDQGAGNQRHPVLGMYIDSKEIHSTAQRSKREFTELRNRYNKLLETEVQLTVDLTDLVSEVGSTHMDPSNDAMKQLQQLLQQIKDISHEVQVYLNGADDDIFRDIDRKQDTSTSIHLEEQVMAVDGKKQKAVQNLQDLVSDQNELVHRHLNLIQDISSLQSDYADLGIALVEMDTKLNTAQIDGFKELNSVKNLLGVYGASLAEAVRRREFSNFFKAKSQSLAELMADVTETERAKRHENFSQVVSQLPFELNMEMQLPVLDVSLRRKSEPLHTVELTRDHLISHLNQLHQLEKQHTEAQSLQAAKILRDASAEVEQHLKQMSCAENSFSLMIKRHLLVDDNDSDDDSDEAHPYHTNSQSAEDKLQKHVHLAQQRSDRLERELQRRAAEWSEERRMLQRAASLASSGREAPRPPEDTAAPRDTPLSSSEKNTITELQRSESLEHLREGVCKARDELSFMDSLLIKQQNALQSGQKIGGISTNNAQKEPVPRDSLKESKPSRNLNVHRHISHLREQVDKLVIQMQQPPSLMHEAQISNNVSTEAVHRFGIVTEGFQVGDIVLFTPTDSLERQWVALNSGGSRYILRKNQALTNLLYRRSWFIAQLTRIEKQDSKAITNATSHNPESVYEVEVNNYKDTQTLLINASKSQNTSCWTTAAKTQGSIRTARKSSAGSSDMGSLWQPSGTTPLRSLTVDGYAHIIKDVNPQQKAVVALARLNNITPSSSPP
ncbi:oligomeric, coiled-coil, peripheral membrane protein [Malassezia yamatoensis]|uniref:Autophagy-related protein 11 n=1 Tax=Malassezia yamatoensis TaxID=253288 RepID=A0AAJ6CI29_9BASI|nr:oligomeric, coiled-coil, peripheral membrane protein [Malassezia yamatoensis]